MKKTIILFALFLVSVSQAKIWRVEQNTAIQADYRDLQTALNAIPAGDTILVSGYGTGWGNIEIKKPVVIIGPGYFLDQYYNSNINQQNVQIQSVTFNAGGENSEVMGCCIGPIAINCNNITIKRNYLTPSGRTNITVVGVNNVVIQQNYMSLSSESYNQYVCIQASGCNNIIIRNNYMNCGQYTLLLSGNSTGIISNNVFNGIVSIVGSQFNNNILVNGSFSKTNSFYNNNIGFDGSFGTNNGNMSNVAMTSIFMNTGTTDGKWQLKDGSPAKGVGLGGTDCGMFGGDFPYVLSGIPPIPTIYDAIVPATGNSRDGLLIRIKARANK